MMTDEDTERAPSVDSTRQVALTWPQLTVIAVVVLTYGFELFNYNVSVDEPLYWHSSRIELFDFWRARGRWGMGVTALLVPSTVVPAVPVAVAVVGMSVSLWVLARRVLNLDEWGAALATTMAVSLPILAFHVSYSINDIGLGVGYAACVISAVAVQGRGPRALVVAVSAGVFAMAIYESFAFALAACFLAVLWRSPTWRMGGQVALSAALAGGGYLVSRIVFAVGTPDIGTALGGAFEQSGDAPGLAANLGQSVGRTLRIVLETPLYLGFSNPLPAVVLSALGVGAAAEVFRRQGSRRYVSILVLLAIPLMPVVCEFITSTLHLRSMLYLPVLVVLTVAAGLPSWRAWAASIGSMGRGVALGVASLAIVGNVTMSNGIFYAGTFLTDQDTVTASQVVATYRSLPVAFEGPLVAVIQTRDLEPPRPPSWRARASFELGVMGNDLDALRFLQMQGLDAVEPTPEETDRGLAMMLSMPAYPREGFMQVRDGLLLINLSTVPER